MRPRQFPAREVFCRFPKVPVVFFFASTRTLNSAKRVTGSIPVHSTRARCVLHGTCWFSSFSHTQAMLATLCSSSCASKHSSNAVAIKYHLPDACLTTRAEENNHACGLPSIARSLASSLVRSDIGRVAPSRVGSVAYPWA